MKKTLSKIYGRTESNLMWSGGYLLECSESKTPTLMECRRLKRQALAEFRKIAGTYEADPEHFMLVG